MGRGGPRNTADLPVILLGILGNIKYKTRLEKLAFLCEMEIFKSCKWYDDWKPYMYGPFSLKLLEDMDRLEKDGLVGIHTVKDPFGHDTKEYLLTESGRHKFNELIAPYVKECRQIRESLSKYNMFASNMPLLRKVYNKYPEYAAHSLITENVGRGQRI